MSVDITLTTIGNVLTRTTGYLRTVTSHSLQPYRGCTFGRALCGVGCYVQHNGHVLRGRKWGGFLEVRTNAAESYRTHFERESNWARRSQSESQTSQGARPGRFSIFCSSSTDPFVPQEFEFGITRSILEAMIEQPPDELVLQTHSHRVTRYLDLYPALAARCALRFHVSIESDLDRLPGLPPPASSVARRLAACALLKQAGLRTIVTVSPLLPVENPERFFSQIGEAADGVVLDHFIEGDGSADGSRTFRTGLPDAIGRVNAAAVRLDYRDQMVAIARRILPGRVGVGIEGFAGRLS
jgi:DNA repair photolyase